MSHACVSCILMGIAIAIITIIGLRDRDINRICMEEDDDVTWKGMLTLSFV